MADNYLENKYEEYLKKKAEYELNLFTKKDVDNSITLLQEIIKTINKL